MNLRCYCCGDTITDEFVLVQNGGPFDQFDRVFVMALGHEEKVGAGHLGSDVQAMVVQETDAPQ